MKRYCFSKAGVARYVRALLKQGDLPLTTTIERGALGGYFVTAVTSGFKGSETTPKDSDERQTMYTDDDARQAGDC